MHQTRIARSLGAFGCLLVGTAASAAVIQTTQISASTALPPFTFGSHTFVVAEMHDGITGDSAPYNGFAANGNQAGTITLTLDQNYDLQSFVLHNDINVADEGVRSFGLTFLDASNAVLGSSGVLSAVSQFAPQTYAFGSVAGVRTVVLDVYTSSLQIEIREVAFNGDVSVVPEPASGLLLLAGVATLGVARRKRRG